MVEAPHWERALGCVVFCWCLREAWTCVLGVSGLAVPSGPAERTGWGPTTSLDSERRWQQAAEGSGAEGGGAGKPIQESLLLGPTRGPVLGADQHGREQGCHPTLPGRKEAKGAVLFPEEPARECWGGGSPRCPPAGCPREGLGGRTLAATGLSSQPPGQRRRPRLDPMWSRLGQGPAREPRVTRARQTD